MGDGVQEKRAAWGRWKLSLVYNTGPSKGQTCAYVGHLQPEMWSRVQRTMHSSTVTSKVEGRAPCTVNVLGSTDHWQGSTLAL